MAVRSNMRTSSAAPVATAPSLTSTIATRAVNKFERIRLVRYLGLNTEDSVLVESPADLDKHASFLSRLDKFSVRTFLPAADVHGAPHFPIVTRAEFESTCLPLLAQNYSLIVAEPIDPADASLAGCIERHSGGFLVEVALGPGTVRRVTKEGKIDQSLELSGADDPRCRPEIAQALRELTKAERHLASELLRTGVLYEFSAYNHPVGLKAEQIIFWEIQGLGEQGARLDRFCREVVAS